MTNWNERNRAVIDEFRANNGRASGPPLLLLTTTGHDFFRVERQSDGRLEMSRAMMEVG